jgi:hypothetical protein
VIVVFLIFYPIAMWFFSKFRISRAEHATHLGELERRAAAQSSTSDT